MIGGVRWADVCRGGAEEGECEGEGEYEREKNSSRFDSGYSCTPCPYFGPQPRATTHWDKWCRRDLILDTTSKDF